jgi:hypothetical protein
MKHIVLNMGGQWVVRQDQRVIGIYPTQKEAILGNKDAVIHRRDGSVRRMPQEARREWTQTKKGG